MTVAVRNESSLPTRRVGSIVRRVLRDLDADDLDVIVADGQMFGGHYHAGWRPDLGQTRPWIGMKVPGVGYPRRWVYYKRKGEMPPPMLIGSWEEALVALTAHEGQHHRQMPRNGYGRRGRGATGKRLPRFREDECEWAAYRAVQRFREQR